MVNADGGLRGQDFRAWWRGADVGFCGSAWSGSDSGRGGGGGDEDLQI